MPYRFPTVIRRAEGLALLAVLLAATGCVRDVELASTPTLVHCAGDGEACSSDDLCCSGTCASGTCGHPECLAEGAACQRSEISPNNTTRHQPVSLARFNVQHFHAFWKRIRHKNAVRFHSTIVSDSQNIFHLLLTRQRQR